jgi:hypothetical protein
MALRLVQRSAPVRRSESEDGSEVGSPVLGEAGKTAETHTSQDKASTSRNSGSKSNLAM